MTNSNQLSSEILKKVEETPGAVALLDAFTSALGESVAIFGGAVRDWIAFGKAAHDLDILTYGKSVEQFRAAAERTARQLGVSMEDFAGSHIAIRFPGSEIFFELHYPKKSLIGGLVRTEFTVNGIGFLWPERRLEDPLGGAEDLQARRLIVHSPQYIVTDAPTFSRMFRTAARLNMKIEGDTEKLLRRFAPLAALHQGKTNLRASFELLRFFSVATIGPWLRQMHELRIIEALFPELAIPAEAVLPDGTPILKRNVELAAGYDEASLGRGEKIFAEEKIGEGITNRALLRLMALFFDLGIAYERYKPDAPYVKGIGGEDERGFAERIERNLLAHVAKRYEDSKELHVFFSEMHHAFVSIRAALARRDAEYVAADVSPAMKTRAMMLYAQLCDV